MVDEFVNNSRDPIEEKFLGLEAQVLDIKCNVNLLMVILNNNLGLFIEYGCSNTEVQSKGRSRDQEEIENKPKKGPKKDQPSFSGMKHSQSLFKMEVKVDIKLYQGEIDTLKLNH